ncbi:MAG: hypothetical protein RQ885_04795 [Desulfurococcales archaeon]|nr:hypothetical protein [Desulfurococcales archaeon]
MEAPIRAITYNRVDILRSHSFIETPPGWILEPSPKPIWGTTARLL